jgi:DNA-binding response OmpR family regulator
MSSDGLMLPDLDGLTLCEVLQREESTRNTPIIMISAVSTEITRCSAKIAGAITFLGKPWILNT